VLSFDELSELVRKRVPNEEPYAVLAESFSGPLAIRLAAENPANLKAIILCATFASNPAPTSLLRHLISPLFFQIKPPRFFVRKVLLGMKADSSLIDDFLNVVGTVSPKVLSARLKVVMIVDEQAALKMCKIPILYLMAKRDLLVNRKSLIEMQRIKPEMKTVEIDGPHFLLQREPVKCVEAIDVFLSHVDPIIW